MAVGPEVPPPRFEGALREGEFAGRPNRFVIECRLDGRRVKAYLPNPGRLRELLLPGASVTLLDGPRRAGRSTSLTAVAVRKGGRQVLLHTHHTNRAARWLLESRLIPGLEGWEIERQEVTFGGSRFDFLLRRGGRRLILEVKSCTLFGERIAMFPDAVTARGRRHVIELSRLADSGSLGGVLFLIHWPNAEYFLPEYHTDPDFALALAQARGRIMIKPLALPWSEDLIPEAGVREVPIPWDVLARENHDRGSYLLVMRLRKSGVPVPGGEGVAVFRQGFYVYVGSAARGLAGKTEGHRRRGRPRQAIDHLLREADLLAVLPVRTKDTLACRLATSVAGVTEWHVPGFDSRDCRCQSHLFGVRSDPLAGKDFSDLVIRFRVDRLLADRGTARLFKGDSAREQQGARQGRPGEERR